MKKVSVLLFSSFLLVACTETDKDKGNADPPEEPTEDVKNDEVASAEEADPDDAETNEEDEPSEMQKTEDLKLLGEYMKEHSFVNEAGVEALKNYIEIDDELTYRELDETGEVVNPNGSSQEEVIEAIDSVVGDVIYETTEDADGDITTITFHYFNPDSPPPEEGDDAEPMNYGDLSFIFEEDNLYLSNVAPGWFEVSMDSMADAEDFTEVKSIKDLPEINPDLEILTIGKMNLNGQPFIQAMTPTKIKDDDDEDTFISHYLYFVDDELIFANYIPFYETSQNFPLYGIQAMYGYFQEMNEQNFD